MHGSFVEQRSGGGVHDVARQPVVQLASSLEPNGHMPFAGDTHCRAQHGWMQYSPEPHVNAPHG